MYILPSDNRAQSVFSYLFIIFDIFDFVSLQIANNLFCHTSIFSKTLLELFVICGGVSIGIPLDSFTDILCSERYVVGEIVETGKITRLIKTATPKSTPC